MQPLLWMMPREIQPLFLAFLTSQDRSMQPWDAPCHGWSLKDATLAATPLIYLWLLPHSPAPIIMPRWQKTATRSACKNSRHEASLHKPKTKRCSVGITQKTSRGQQRWEIRMMKEESEAMSDTEIWPWNKDGPWQMGMYMSSHVAPLLYILG